MPERYLLTRYLTDKPNMFNEFSEEAFDSISEVHFADKLGAQGTYGVDLDEDFAEYISKADNLLPVNGLMRLSDYGLGAAVEVPEVFEPMEELVADYPDEATPSERFYANGLVLDQGKEGACVGFSGAAFLNGGPIRSFRDRPVAWLEDFAMDLYHECQRNDPWPGENYSGTSVAACVKILVQRGLIEGGAETRSLETMDKFVLNVSSMMLASDWFEGMYRTDANGFIRPTGRKVGGHAYRKYGLSRWRTAYIRNSWGGAFGDGGNGYMSLSDRQWMAKYGNLRGYAAKQIRK